MQETDINELMRATASDAVNYASEQYQCTLDGSLDSLPQVDTMLSELHQQHLQQAHSAEILFTLSNLLGAYCGEVFIARLGGTWRQNTADPKAPFTYVQYQDKEFPFSSICYHKIVTDNSISLQSYIQQAMANAMQ